MKNSDINYLHQQFYEVIESLEDRERQILEMRFGIMEDCPATLEEVSALFSINREEIRQLESDTLRKLRLNTIDQEEFLESFCKKD